MAVKCPYCGRELDHLEMITEEEWARDFRVTGVGAERRYLRTRDWYFCCPYCHAVLTDCENVARDILRGVWKWG
jgi:hypothetical protein